MNRASELRSARFLILELYPCLASKDEQAIKECIFSEYGALDAYVDLVEIEDALEHLQGVQAEWASPSEVSHVS